MLPTDAGKIFPVALIAVLLNLEKFTLFAGYVIYLSLFALHSTQGTEGRLNLNFQAHPCGVAFLNP